MDKEVVVKLTKVRPVRKYSRNHHELRLLVCSMFMIMVLMLMVLNVHVYAGSFVNVVYVDGKETGIISDEGTLMSFVANLCFNEGRVSGMDVMLIQEVTIEQERRPNAVPDNVALKNRLREELSFDYFAYMIMVNDKPTLAVQNLADYDKVLNAIEQAYISGNENAVVQAVVLNEKVEPKWQKVNPGALYSAESAVDILLRGTDRRQTYLVSRGDTIWSIAQSHNLTVDEVKQANPQLASETIRPGEELSLVVAEPLVHVSVTEEVTFEEKIPFNTEYRDDKNLYKGTSRIITAGRQGLREATYLITRVSGREVSKELIDETIMEEPRTQIVARGTAVAPITGSGRFLWPVSGGGRITSRYGQRGRSFHYGVDIAGPVGTPIVAADAGVVTSSGWAGSYGILVTIDHGNGYVTKYAHNSSTLVTVGQKVQKGAQIARMGSTGNSTGPHLHFEIIHNGRNVNPLNFF
jgi:murein DD-endopeptidase MepM/ murein hydrolase activator NlpD